VINNPPKFIILLVALLGLLTLVAMGKVAWDEVDVWFGTIVGYGVGNGIAAAKGQPSTPVFGTKKGTRA